MSFSHSYASSILTANLSDVGSSIECSFANTMGNALCGLQDGPSSRNPGQGAKDLPRISPGLPGNEAANRWASDDYMGFSWTVWSKTSRSFVLSKTISFRVKPTTS